MSYDPYFIVRADAPCRARSALISGRRLRARADARRVRRHGHARRGVSRRGLHLADARPDAGGDQGRRRRRRRAPHRQELHRRRHELRDGRRARRAEGIEVEAVVVDDDVAVQDSPLHGRPARRRRHGLPEKIAGAAAERRPAAEGGRGLAASQRQRPHHGHGAHVVHRARRRQADLRARRRRDGDRHRHPRRAGPRAA